MLVSLPADGSPTDLFMTDYQRERQRVYDRADHMLSSSRYAHAEVQCAKAEAALVRGEAQISRARGEQLGWLKADARGATARARYGYRNPVDMVVSRLDVRRDLARELVYLAQRLDDDTVRTDPAGRSFLRHGWSKRPDSKKRAHRPKRSPETRDLVTRPKVRRVLQRVSAHDQSRREASFRQPVRGVPTFAGRNSCENERTPGPDGSGDLPPGSRPPRRTTHTCRGRAS